MAPGLSGQTSIFGVVFFVSKSLLGIERQKKLRIFIILTRKPRNLVRILTHWTWDIPKFGFYLPYRGFQWLKSFALVTFYWVPTCFIGTQKWRKIIVVVVVVVVFKDSVIVWFASCGFRWALLFLLRPLGAPLNLTDGSPRPTSGHYVLQAVHLSLEKLRCINCFKATEF